MVTDQFISIALKKSSAKFKLQRPNRHIKKKSLFLLLVIFLYFCLSITIFYEFYNKDTINMRSGVFYAFFMRPSY